MLSKVHGISPKLNKVFDKNSLEFEKCLIVTKVYTKLNFVWITFKFH